MGSAVGGMIPGFSIACECHRVGDTLFGGDALEGCEPVPVISLAGVGVAAGLRPFDLVAQYRRPLTPIEETTLVQCHRHREGLGFPRLAKYRALRAARDVRHRRDGLVDAHAGER